MPDRSKQAAMSDRHRTVSNRTYRRRLGAGWSEDRAATKRPQKRSPTIRVGGVVTSVAAACHERASVLRPITAGDGLGGQRLEGALRSTFVCRPRHAMQSLSPARKSAPPTGYIAPSLKRP